METFEFVVTSIARVALKIQAENVEAANRLYRFSLYYDKWHY